MSKRRLSISSEDTLSIDGGTRTSRIRTASPQRTRVVVNLHDQASAKLIIPVTSSTTIAELKSQTLCRAERLAVKIPDGETELHLEGEAGPIAFEEDTIGDVFGNVEPKLIWVTSVNRDSKVDAELVYMRWITHGRALDHLSILDIEADKEPLTSDMTVAEITDIAKSRVFGAAGNELTPEVGSSVGLWFSRTAYNKPIWAQGIDTIGALHLSGTLENPLNAFLVLMSSDNADPSFEFGFRCSQRGRSTFTTCLKVLVSAAISKPHLIPLLPERMGLVTGISETGKALESILSLDQNRVRESRAYSIIANCFREIALRMIPSAFIGDRNECVLEGSRQIFAWMFGDILEEVAKPINGERMSLPATHDFPSIISACNSSQFFHMLSPVQLDGRQVSGISLCSAGYVSYYTPHDVQTFQPSLENVVIVVENLQPLSGKSRLQALQPLISQRRIDGTWEIDDWELKVESTPLATPVDAGPDEAIVICLDQSISMDSPLGNDWIGRGQANSLRRFDEARQVFRNVISRLTAYHLNVHVGLVTFGEEPKEEVEIAPIGKGLKDKLENTEPTGCGTALFDALSDAHNMLTIYRNANPRSNMKLRIIALTDGCDNRSTLLPTDVCHMLFQDQIILDSIVIGGPSSEDLFKISKHTGGYAFQPTSRLLLFQTFLLEPFLDIHARPDIVTSPPPADWNTSMPKEADMTTLHDFPPCRPHELQDGNFVSLDAATRQLAAKSSSLLQIARSSASGEPQERSGRLFLDEMRLMIANPHASMDIYVSEEDMAFWKVVMSGPNSTAYSEGTFALFLHMTETYPQKAPTVRFITPVLHPNVSKHGRICHEMLNDGWKSSIHIHDILKTIFTIFENPQASCDAAIDELATLKFWTDRAAADAEIMKYVTKFASRTRAEWKTEMESMV